MLNIGMVLVLEMVMVIRMCSSIASTLVQTHRITTMSIIELKRLYVCVNALSKTTEVNNKKKHRKSCSYHALVSSLNLCKRSVKFV